ncbi:MAG: peptidyl-prolyl cis-trans isomerase [Firmicutes bacterium]|nr:peptidyl-prolyl cis-trans isomerase [Bacillota bacterium]
MPGLRGFLSLATWLLLLICCAGCLAADVPAARVNDVIISQNDLNRFISLMELCNPGTVDLRDDNRPKENEREFLHLLIGFELLDQAAANAGVVVAPGELEVKMGEMQQSLVQRGYAGSLAEFHKKCKELCLDPGDLALFSRYRLQVEALFEQMGSTVQEEDLLRFVGENPEIFMQPAAAELYLYRFNDEQEATDCLVRLERGTAAEEIAASGNAHRSNLGWVTGDDPFLSKEVREQIFPAHKTGKGCLIRSSGEYHLYWIQRVRPAGQLDFTDVREEAFQLIKSLLYEQFYYTLWKEGRIELHCR